MVRKYNIEGQDWTPLADVAGESGRWASVVRKYLDRLGGSTQVIQPAPFQRRLLMMKSNDVAALLELLKQVPMHNTKRKRNQRAAVNTIESGQAPTASTAANGAEFVQTLRKLKSLADELGIKLDELVFEKGEAHFPRLKLEVIKL